MSSTKCYSKKYTCQLRPRYYDLSGKRISKRAAIAMQLTQTIDELTRLLAELSDEGIQVGGEKNEQSVLQFFDSAD